MIPPQAVPGSCCSLHGPWPPPSCHGVGPQLGRPAAARRGAPGAGGRCGCCARSSPAGGSLRCAGPRVVQPQRASPRRMAGRELMAGGRSPELAALHRPLLFRMLNIPTRAAWPRACRRGVPARRAGAACRRGVPVPRASAACQCRVPVPRANPGTRGAFWLAACASRNPCYSAPASPVQFQGQDLVAWAPPLARLVHQRQSSHGPRVPHRSRLRHLWSRGAGANRSVQRRVLGKEWANLRLLDGDLGRFGLS
jgi:hypothetical protein